MFLKMLWSLSKLALPGSVISLQMIPEHLEKELNKIAASHNMPLELKFPSKDIKVQKK